MTILQTAANLLRVYSTDRPDLTVTEACALLGLPKSNASRLLRAMRDAGLLETVGATKRYRPSVLLHQAGQVFRTASTLLKRADAVVQSVTIETGHTGYVSRIEGRHVLALTDHPGSRPLRVASSIGRRLEAFASATGRSLLARWSDAEVSALYPAPLPVLTPTAPADLDDLLKRLAAVRRDGFAESSDESIRGVGAIAAAVGDPATGDVVSLCIAFPAATITPDERREIARTLTRGAQEIARLSGDPDFPRRPAILED